MDMENPFRMGVVGRAFLWPQINKCEKERELLKLRYPRDASEKKEILKGLRKNGVELAGLYQDRQRRINVLIGLELGIAVEALILILL